MISRQRYNDLTINTYTVFWEMASKMPSMMGTPAYFSFSFIAALCLKFRSIHKSHGPAFRLFGKYSK